MLMVRFLFGSILYPPPSEEVLLGICCDFLLLIVRAPCGSILCIRTCSGTEIADLLYRLLLRGDPFGIMQIKGMTSGEVIVCVLLYGVQMTPFSCLLSNLFSPLAMAQDAVLGINIGLIFILGLTRNRLLIFSLVLISRAASSANA